MADTRVVIVGGGIGGLTATIALRRAGIEATCFERATDVRRIQLGGGLHLWPNAMKAFRKVGLDDAVHGAGADIENVFFRDWRGRLLGRLPVGDISRRLGSVSVNVARSELHAALLGALERDALRLGSECVRITDEEGRVRVALADGTEELADVVVGADGVRSTVRTHTLGPGAPRYAGYSSWVAISDADHEALPDNAHTIVFGRGPRFIHGRVAGRRVYWAATRNVPEGYVEHGSRKAELLEAFSGFAEPVRTLLEATPEDAVARLDVYDRPPDESWGRGRVTLLGDAAHPMTPNVAQGACMAIEDAVALAESLRDSVDPETALRAYEARRLRRTAGMQRRAHFVGRLLSFENRAACALRDRTFTMLMPLIRRGEEKDLAYEV